VVLCRQRKISGAENERLRNRIAELEERLCPCEEHDWKQVCQRYVMVFGGWDSDTIIKYKCKRYGKIIERNSYKRKVNSMCDAI